MRIKLAAVKVLLAIFTVVVIIISMTSVFPAMTGDIHVDIPEEDEIEWEIHNDDLYLRGDMWVNNSGYYDLQDITISVDIIGFNRTLFSETRSISTVASGENRRIDLEFVTSLDDFSEEELEKLTFDGTSLDIVSEMTSSYPFSILGFHLDYETIYNWKGLVKNLEYYEDDIEISTTDEGAIISVPYVVETSDYLTGFCEVYIQLINDENEVISDSDLTVQLGVYDSGNIDFFIEEDMIEELLFEDSYMTISSTITFTDFDFEVEHRESYFWEAPIENFELFYNEADVEHEDGETKLTLPYEVSTKGLTDTASLTIYMWDEEEEQKYSEDHQYIPLGRTWEETLRFPISDEYMEQLIINSQTILFEIEVSLLEEDIDFKFYEEHDWGAPLNEFETIDISFNPITEIASADIYFRNESPWDIHTDILIEIFDDNELIEKKSLSYEDDPDYIVESNEEFEETFEIEIDREPTHTIIIFEDANTEMKFERKVGIDG